MHELFRELAHVASEAAGTAWALILATGVIIMWALSDPLFGFSDT
jgi:low affinity Fe/Cu permease